MGAPNLLLAPSAIITSLRPGTEVLFDIAPAYQHNYLGLNLCGLFLFVDERFA